MIPLLKNLLLNEGQSQISGSRKVIVPPNMRGFVKSNFSIAMGSDLELFRGAEYGLGVHFINPQRIVRSSKDSSNIYYILMDTLPSWEGFPSRSKSLICTNDVGIAEGYGSKVYSVFPNNRTKIGYGKYKNAYLEFSEVFRRVKLDIDQFSRYLTLFLAEILKSNSTVYSLVNSSMKHSDFNTVIDTLNKMDVINIVSNMYFDSMSIRGRYTSQISSDFLKNGKNGDLIGYLDGIMDPTKNGIH